MDTTRHLTLYCCRGEKKTDSKCAHSSTVVCIRVCLSRYVAFDFIPLTCCSVPVTNTTLKIFMRYIQHTAILLTWFFFVYMCSTCGQMSVSVSIRRKAVASVFSRQFMSWAPVDINILTIRGVFEP